MILLHGFGQRYDLPIGLALYLFAAGGVVFISFVLVVLFAGEQVGAKAIEYPRRALPWLLPFARSPWPRLVGGAIGVIGLLTPIAPPTRRGHGERAKGSSQGKARRGYSIAFAPTCSPANRTTSTNEMKTTPPAAKR